MGGGVSVELDLVRGHSSAQIHFRSGSHLSPRAAGSASRQIRAATARKDSVKIASFICTFLLLVASSGNALTEFHQSARPDGSMINYYLTKPAAPKFPIVLVVQGSGCDSAYAPDRKTFTFKNGEEAARLDIEKYGISASSAGCTLEFLKHNRISQRIADHLQVISLLRNAPWWNGRLFILGGSEGGIVGGALASLIPETKAAGLMSSPLGSTMAESWLKVSERALRKKGLGNRQISENLIQIKNKFKEIRLNPTPDLNYAGEANTYLWWADILDFGTYNLLLGSNVPIIFFQGDQDEMSDVDGARKLVTLFNNAKKTNLTYREMSGMGHTFNDQNGQSHLNEVLTEILGFFAAH
jgi:pimeloyl-ACP methyl ester carboxylesterase